MPHERFRTKIRRDLANAKSGRRNKRRRQNRGSTASFPLEGKMPTTSFGQVVDKDAVKTPKVSKK